MPANTQPESDPTTQLSEAEPLRAFDFRAHLQRQARPVEGELRGAARDRVAQLEGLLLTLWGDPEDCEDCGDLEDRPCALHASEEVWRVGFGVPQHDACPGEGCCVCIDAMTRLRERLKRRAEGEPRRVAGAPRQPARRRRRSPDVPLTDYDVVWSGAMSRAGKVLTDPLGLGSSLGHGPSFAITGLRS